ncbi:MAG TPA: YciI family protein [Candidatus Polarisedimenticolaceae bacterium]|nr:YciI family protein [Candidatus Polarisedimenticolaceae bacterium]
MKHLAILTLAVSSFLLVRAEPAPPAPVKPEYEMFKVQLVLLKTGPSKEETAPDDARQSQHIAGLESLLKAHKALIVGPIEGSGDLRGLVVLDVETKAEAEKLLASDPWLASGHLVADYHTWFVAKRLFRPLAGPFLDVEACTLGLLVRPPNAPELGADERASIQAGHMANIEAMAAAGDLAIAGPFVEDAPLRGVFVFRTVDRPHIDELVAKDPAIQRGRLKLEPYTWWVSKGVLPAR